MNPNLCIIAFVVLGDHLPLTSIISYCANSTLVLNNMNVWYAFRFVLILRQTFGKKNIHNKRKYIYITMHFIVQEEQIKNLTKFTS